MQVSFYKYYTTDLCLFSYFNFIQNIKQMSTLLHTLKLVFDSG